MDYENEDDLLEIEQGLGRKIIEYVIDNLSRGSSIIVEHNISEIDFEKEIL
jgi:hypothetical protein